MSIRTTLYTRISFLDKSYNSKEEVLEDYEYNKKYIDTLKQSLYSLVVITEPRKHMSEDNLKEFEDPLDWLTFRYNSDMRELTDAMMEQANLEILLKEWDNCHEKDTGLAINPPTEVCGKSFLTGDFVKSLNYL